MYAKTTFVDGSGPGADAAFLNGLQDEIILIETAEVATELTFSGTWTHYSAAGGTYERGRFWDDPFGMVFVEGLVAKNGVPAASEVIATLPSGYRPRARHMFAVAAGADGGGATVYGRVDVLPDGTLLWMAGQTGGTGNRWVDLSTIKFRRSDREAG